MAKKDKDKPSDISDTEEQLAENKDAETNAGDASESDTADTVSEPESGDVTDTAQDTETETPGADEDTLTGDAAEGDTVEGSDGHDDMADGSDQIEDAEIIEPEESTAEAEDTTETALVDGDATEDTTATSDAEAEPEPEQTSEPAPAPEVTRETVVEKKAGFVPMLLGGIIAGGIGFGVGQYGGLMAPPPNPFETEAREALDVQSKALEAQGAQIEGLSEQLDDTQKAVEIINTAPLASAVATLEDSLKQTGQEMTALSDQVAGFDSRMTAIEKQPLTGALSPEAIAAYERELEELRNTIAEQRAAMEAQQTEMAGLAASGDVVEGLRAELATQTEAIAALNARIDALAEDNAAAEAAAAEKETRAANLVALADVTAAVQSGEAFAEPLAVLQASGIAVPDALLSGASDGVPTQAALIEAYPPLARAALKAARSAGTAGDEEAGFANFFKNQLGARSVTPREGDSADAVLSRAEAAVASGDLETALAEVGALPDAVRTVFDDWVAQADARKAALAALDGLSQTITQE